MLKLCSQRLAAIAVAATVALSACTGVPDGLTPVEGFELDRYLGTWYEIARLDHRFERGLSEVTATYEAGAPGTVKVINRGFDTDKGEWDDIVGKAKFVDAEDVGRLKVSFFGPFYGAYNIIELGEDYDYAMVSGPNRSYLWILARSPDLPAETRDRLVSRAADLGFDTAGLIFVEHGAETPPSS